MSDADLAHSGHHTGHAAPASTSSSRSGPDASEKRRNVPPGFAMMALILACAIGAWVLSGIFLAPSDQATVIPQTSFMLAAMIVLSLVLPLVAYSYYFFRRERRQIEVERIIARLKPEHDRYAQMFRNIHSGPYFVIAVGMTWVISLGGLATLFFGDVVWPEPELDRPETDDTFPKNGSQLVFGMAFLGAYIWGLQYALRRYVLNDLIPGAFFKLSIRMVLASTVALILFNAYASLIEGDPGKEFWPALAFLLGAFPQRGLNWLMARLPILSEQPDSSVRVLPLEMIEGLDAYDRMRLEEIGIDDCYDLANYDFVPLVLKTSYEARKIADWILQAKLCVRCGDAVSGLRLQGIRGIHEMKTLEKTDITELAKVTPATASSMWRAKREAEDNPDIECLQIVAGQLSKYTSIVPPGVPGGPGDAGGKATVAPLPRMGARSAKPEPISG